VFAWADPERVTATLLEKRRRQVRLSSSAFFGLDAAVAADPRSLPCLKPRIAYRQITNATNTRTVLAALVPAPVILTNAAPYLLRRSGDEKTEAYLLGCLCSIPLDWYARRLVEQNLNFHILNGLPIPQPPTESVLRKRVVELAGRLAARDERFSEWADAVGVSVGSVADADEEADLIAELDALASRLYGLSRAELDHVFATFHRGWQYGPRLDKVLMYFDELEGAS
jgi:hypothetical protein